MDHLLTQLFDAYFKLDSQGRFVSVQGKTASLFQTNQTDLLGKNIWENFPQLAGGELDHKLQAAASQGKIMRVNGALLPDPGWLEITIRPVDDGIECFVRDISAYQQTQPGPTHDETGRIIFDALLESIPEGIIIADASAPDGQYPFLVVSRYAADILSIPRQTLLAYTLADLLNQVQFFESDSEAPVSIENHPLTRFIRDGVAEEDLDFVLRSRQGRQMAISIKGGPVRNQDGQIIAGIFSWMDISERKEQENKLQNYSRQLEQSNNDLATFASTASHDLQEPLRKIRAFSEMLQKRYSENLDNDAQDLLQRIYSAASRMQLLIKGLLEYSQMGTQANTSQVDLNETLQAVQADLEITVRRLNGRVEVAGLPVVHANPIRMHQLFLNLVSNGLKFHDPEKEALVRVYPTGQSQNWVQIAVEDNGIGFDINLLDQILQPFKRLHDRNQYEGSGIGLAVCRRIVEQLGGQLTANSAPGQGSTFFVTLPLSSTGETSRAV